MLPFFCSKKLISDKCRQYHSKLEIVSVCAHVFMSPHLYRDWRVGYSVRQGVPGAPCVCVCPLDEHMMQFSQLTSNEWTCQTHTPHGYCLMLPWQHSSVLCGLNCHSSLSWLPKQWRITALLPHGTGEEHKLCSAVISVLLMCIVSYFIKYQQQTYVTLDQKNSLKSLGYICSNSQKYIVCVKLIDFSFMPKIIRILSKDHVPWIYLVNVLP